MKTAFRVEGKVDVSETTSWQSDCHTKTEHYPQFPTSATVEHDHNIIAT